MPYKDIEVRKKKAVERSAKWQKSNPAKAAENARKWRRNNPEVILWHAAKRRSLRDGTPFTISKEDIPDIPQICPIALIPIHFREDNGQGPCDNSPSLDQIVAGKGYIPGNIRIVSHKGNRWKSDMTIVDVQRLLGYMLGT